MAALAIGGKLHFVDSDEIRFEVERHGLDRADIEARRGGLDLLFPGDQRDLGGADPGDDLVVDLAREQPERQPDNADVMREHALDGEVGLAGIGRAEHGGDAAAALQICGMRGERPTYP